MSLVALASAGHFFFFFNDTATTEIYTLSLHDALPISAPPARSVPGPGPAAPAPGPAAGCRCADAWRRAARSEEHTLNSSHSQISYAVFCLKKKTLIIAYRSEKTITNHQPLRLPTLT